MSHSENSIKTGRNAACYCGSGRKYKHCHARPPASRPYHVPLLLRIAGVALSIFLLYYGTVGIIANDIYIPPKYAHQNGVHWHGLGAWLIYTSFLCAASAILAAILRHYHDRKYENIYRPLIKWSQITACTFAVAVVMVRIADTIN